MSLVGAKVVDKAGKVVSDMLGFSHYDENMKILGSTGIDKANPNNGYYVEVVGEFVPGVSSNITATSVDARTATTMENLIMVASDAILYAEDPGTAVGARPHLHLVQPKDLARLKYLVQPEVAVGVEVLELRQCHQV